MMRRLPFQQWCTQDENIFFKGSLCNHFFSGDPMLFEKERENITESIILAYNVSCAHVACIWLQFNWIFAEFPINLVFQIGVSVLL